MRLNKQTSYAIKMLTDCARSGDAIVKVAVIAERNGLTLQHALKIAHVLMRAGFLINQRGRQGGIRLARPAHEIRIGEIVRTLETTFVEETGAPLDSVLDDALSAFIGVLDQHTLQDFVKPGRISQRATKASAKGSRATIKAPTGRRRPVALPRGAPVGRMMAAED